MNERGHLKVQRPAAGAGPAPQAAVGLQKLDLGSRRDSYIYVPKKYQADRPMPLVLLLHGAGGHAHDGLRIFLHLADQAGLILVAPASHASTWDIIAKRTYGPDLALVDARSSMCSRIMRSIRRGSALAAFRMGPRMR